MGRLGLRLVYLVSLVALSCGYDAQPPTGGTRIKPTLFTNNRVYALQNQHTGHYLTVGNEGEPYRSNDNGELRPNQQWRVKAINKNGFQLVPINGQAALEILWKPIYIGYGSYLLEALGTDQCLEAHEKKPVTPCDEENNLNQHWVPTRIRGESKASTS